MARAQDLSHQCDHQHFDVRLEQCAGQGIGRGGTGHRAHGGHDGKPLLHAAHEQFAVQLVEYEGRTCGHRRSDQPADVVAPAQDLGNTQPLIETLQAGGHHLVVPGMVQQVHFQSPQAGGRPRHVGDRVIHAADRNHRFELLSDDRVPPQVFETRMARLARFVVNDPRVSDNRGAVLLGAADLPVFTQDVADGVLSRDLGHEFRAQRAGHADSALCFIHLGAPLARAGPAALHGTR